MPTYVIEREIPGIGAWSPQQFQKAAEKSRAVLRELGPEIQWLTKLRDQRLALLRLHRARPRPHQGARRSRRLPVQPSLRGASSDRPGHRRDAVALAACG
jgi:hypothetical protein